MSFETRVSFKYSRISVLPLPSNDLATIFREILICLTIVKHKFHSVIFSFFFFSTLFFTRLEVIVIKIFLLSALLSPLISDMSCFSGKYENNEIRTMASFFFFLFLFQYIRICI